jgi:hypothetical protein
MVAGLLGYATIVVLFGLLNVLMGRSFFFTPAMLGATLFYGLEDPAALEITPGPVLAYNMVHVLALVALGTLASWLASKAEQYPVARYLILFVLIFVAAHVYTALLVFAQPLIAGVWWQVGLVSVAAALVMGWYLVTQHPLLRRGLTEQPMGEEGE